MELEEFFQNHKKVALAFSGGVDSAYLWYAAVKYGAEVKAYYFKTAFQPQFEYEDALRLAKELNGDLTVLAGDVLSDEAVCANPKNRCYFCKKKMFSALVERARKDGYSIILDGTNASDDAGDRPGMVALRELSVKSPLRECGLSKDTIRRRSKEAGLFTWDKPAYACLATRIPTDERITEEKLSKVEAAEDYLRNHGFTDFRVRLLGESAKLQIPASQMGKVIEHREEILLEFKNHFQNVLLDLEAR